MVCLGLESRPRLDYSNIGKQDVCPALPFPIISPAFLESTGIDTTSYPQLGLTEAQRWCNHGLHGHTELVILSIRTFQPPKFMASCRPSVRQVSSTSHRGRFCNRLAGQKRHSLAWSSALWSPQTESPHLARPWCLWCAHRSYPEARHSSGACWSVTWSRKSRGKELLGEALRHGQLVVDFHEFQRGSLPRKGSSRMPPQGSRRHVRRDKKVSMIAANANGAIKQAIWETRSCSLGLETCDAISSTSHLIIHQDQNLIPSPLLPNSFPTALALVINVTIQNWSVHLENEKGLRNIMKPIIFTVRVLWHSSSVPSVLKHGLLKIPQL